MRHLIQCTACAAAIAIMLAIGTGLAVAQTGAVEQSIPPAVSQSPKLPPLHLTDAQRGKIRAALRDVNTEVDFALKSNQPAEAFTPTTGAKIPAGLHPHSLPPPLLDEMPVLRDYTYLKFKQQVLIID